MIKTMLLILLFTFTLAGEKIILYHTNKLNYNTIEVFVKDKDYTGYAMPISWTAIKIYKTDDTTVLYNGTFKVIKWKNK